MTWDSDKVTIYANGEYMTHRSGKPTNLKRWDDPPDTRLTITDLRSNNAVNNKTAFDDLMIFNRPLSAVEVKSLYRRGERDIPTPTTRIARARAPIQSDGEMAADEWKEAAGVTGFVDSLFGNLVAKDVFARLAHNKENLYCLVESRKADSKAGSFVEVWLAADEKAPAENTYCFRVTRDGSKSQSAGNDHEWTKPWNAAWGESAQDEFAEIAIPFKTIGLDSASAKSLRINILKSWSKDPGDWASWADTTRVGDARLQAKTYGKIELAGQVPVVGVDSLGSKGRADFIGWWENQDLIEQSPKDNKMKCSLWKGKGRLLVLLGYASGDKNTPGATKITLDTASLGLRDRLKATDWWTREQIAMEGDSFTAEVKGSSWRMIGVESK